MKKNKNYTIIEVKRKKIGKYLKSKGKEICIFNIYIKKAMKVLGNVNVNGENKQLGVTKEGDLYKYTLENEVVGVFDPDIMADTLIVFRENTLENELSSQIRDEITQIIEIAGKEEILRTEPEKEQEENVYDRQMGYQKAVGREEDKKLEREDETLDKDKRKKEITEETTEKVENTTGDIQIKQEVDMDAMATDMDSVGERLEKAGKIKGPYEKGGKLGIVESDELDNLRDENGERLEGHSSRYEAVVITNKTGRDGKPIVRALDLENDTQEGTNPEEQTYQVSQNKNQPAKKGDVLTRLKVQGQETIGIEKGQYGEVEVYHSSDKTIGGNGIEGNKSLDKQLETSNSKNAVEGMDEQTQKLSQEYQDGYRSVEASYQEAKKHEKAQEEPCEEIEQKDMDGNPNTSSHNHIDDTVTLLMKNDKIKDTFTEREVREMVVRAWDRKGDKNLEEFQKDVKEDIEADAENMRGERGM